MKSFLQFLKESAAVPKRQKFIDDLNKSSLTPEQRAAAIKEWDQDPRNNEFEPVDPEHLKRLEAESKAESKAPKIGGITDEEERLNRLRAQLPTEDSIIQQQLQADPTAATILYGPGGQGGGLAPFLPYPLGAGAAKALPAAVKAAENITRVPKAVNLVKNITGVGKPLLPQIGAGAGLAGRVIASNLLHTAADYGLDAAGVKNPYIRTAVSTAAAFAPWAPGPKRIPAEMFTGTVVGTGLQALHDKSHYQAYEDVKWALKNNPELSSEEQQKNYDNSFEYYNSPAKYASYGMMFGPKGALVGAAAGQPLDLVQRGIEQTADYFKNKFK